DLDNLSLSDRRAEAVAGILSDTFGVPPENLVTQGDGKQFLKIDTQTAERLNRRGAIRRIPPLMSERWGEGADPPGLLPPLRAGTRSRSRPGLAGRRRGKACHSRAVRCATLCGPRSGGARRAPLRQPADRAGAP